MRKKLFLIVAGLVIAGLAASYMFAVIPSNAVTATRLEILRAAGEALRADTGSCPSSVAQIAAASPKHPKTFDGWDRPIILRCTPNGLATLESLGADGEPGGSGKDADQSVTF